MRQRASKLLVVGATTCCAAAMVDHAASEAVENLIATSVSRVAEKVEAANAPAVTVVAAPRGMPHSRVRAVTGADAALVIDRVSAGSWGRSVWRALVEDEPRSNLEKLVLLLAVRSRAAYSAMSDGEAREKLGQALRGAARPVHLWVELSGEASLSELQSLTAWGRELAAEGSASVAIRPEYPIEALALRAAQLDETDAATVGHVRVGAPIDDERELLLDDLVAASGLDEGLDASAREAIVRAAGDSCADMGAILRALARDASGFDAAAVERAAAAVMEDERVALLDRLAVDRAADPADREAVYLDRILARLCFGPPEVELSSAASIMSASSSSAPKDCIAVSEAIGMCDGDAAAVLRLLRPPECIVEPTLRSTGDAGARAVEHEPVAASPMRLAAFRALREDARIAAALDAREDAQHREREASFRQLERQEVAAEFEALRGARRTLASERRSAVREGSDHGLGDAGVWARARLELERQERALIARARALARKEDAAGSAAPAEGRVEEAVLAEARAGRLGVPLDEPG